MKKLFNGLLAALMCTNLCACSNGSDSVAEASSVSSSEETKTLEVDENLLTVEYTIPASFYEDTTAEEAAQEMIDTGNYIDVTINEDGSITAKQTKAKRDEGLVKYRQQIDEQIEEYLNGEDAVASFISIDYSNDMDEFSIYVDPNTYSEWDTLYALTFEMSGYFYQLMNGVSVDDMDVIVNFINNDTGEILNTASLRSLLDNAQS